MMAMAQPQPQPMMAVPQPALAAAPVQQQSPLGTAAIGLILSNPNLFDRILGAIGRLLAQRGMPRLQMNPATPASFSPALIPASQAALIAQPQAGQPAIPQQLYYAPPGQNAPQQPNCPPSQPNCPTPSPQQPPVTPSPQGAYAAPSHSHQGGSSLLGRLFHHD